MELDFDPTDPSLRDDPYPTLNALREATPVLHVERFSRWFITRYEDVRACLRDRRLGRSFDHVPDREGFAAAPRDPRLADFYESERWSLLSLEPPDHTRIRKLVAAAFTPRSIERMREPATALAAELLEPLVEAGSFELLTEFAQPYSIGLICRMLGVPTDRSRDLLDWSHAIVKMYELDTSEEQTLAANAAAAGFRDYVVELIADRRRNPRDDMVSALADVRVDGQRLDDAEIVSTVIVLLNAGHEATVNTLGNGMRALARHPAEWRRLLEGEVPVATAIEELIRFDPPLQLFERWVLEDGFEVADTPIPRGQKIAMLFGSANHDPRAFADPERFDVGREDASQHVGFGGGIHFCIGAPLARVELTAALSALRERCPGFRLAEQPRRLPVFVIWGLEGVRIETG